MISLFDKLRKSNDGAEIAIKIIIVAAIALLVLIIVIVMFSSKIKVFGTNLQKCVSKGGTCEGSGCEPNEVTVPDTDCTNVCCLDIYESATDNTN